MNQVASNQRARSVHGVNHNLFFYNTQFYLSFSLTLTPSLSLSLANCDEYSDAGC